MLDRGTKKLRSLLALALIAVAVGPVRAGSWPGWRGPDQNGVSTETGLVSSWSTDGENLIWKADFIGRSTPVVLHGQVCVIGRTGEGIHKQEVVACFDAGTGEKRWEHRFNVYHTTVAFNRVGWASLAGDPETGNIYAHGVAGQLHAYSKDGEILWSVFTAEELGRLSGYGGRTQTPLVDGDQLLITFVTSGWGSQAAPRHRYFSFDKRTGELLWVSTPGAMPKDMNTQSGPVVAEIAGRRLLIAGNADGHVYAVEVANGRKVWSFPLSQRGLNSTVLVAGETVFVSHSEENRDDAAMGRLVAFKATGSGDLADQEIWRINELSAGFPSPAYLDGKLYVVDNSANLRRINAADGSVDWELNVGRVGKASPVLADGKLYLPETNGLLNIVDPTGDEPVLLDMTEMKSEGDRYAEIYGSPAVAYGRVYLSTEGALYCIGDKDRPFVVEDTPGATPKVPTGKGRVAFVRVSPAEVRLRPGESVNLVATLYNAKGQQLRSTQAEWQVDGPMGELDGPGTFVAATDPVPSSGTIVASSGGITGRARVRVIPDLPWVEDFESHAIDSVPEHWIGAKGKYKVVELEGRKVLAKLKRARGLLRNPMFLGGDFSDYTIEADVMGGQIKRRKTDIGLLASGYTLDLMGNHQRLQIRSWTAERRMATEVDFAWEMGVWYRMKFQVQTSGGKGLLRGKVWKRDAPEPEEWTLTAEDPLPILSGSPGLTGYSPVDLYYDNIEVTVN